MSFKNELQKVNEKLAQKAIKLNPNYFDAYTMMSNILIDCGKINEAVNIDGDVKNNTPVKISILNKKLPIFY